MSTAKLTLFHWSFQVFEFHYSHILLAQANHIKNRLATIFQKRKQYKSKKVMLQRTCDLSRFSERKAGIRL
jgi:hypothetical protein